MDKEGAKPSQDQVVAEKKRARKVYDALIKGGVNEQVATNLSVEATIRGLQERAGFPPLPNKPSANPPEIKP